MTEETQVREQPHSVKIAVNAKKKYSGEVKCYSSTPKEAFEAAMHWAKELEELIALKNKD